jgi:parallel beta-helix repeat protein
MFSSIVLRVFVWISSICICMTAGAANYFVAPGGSNANAGTSAGQAWGTLQFAASRVAPGDTVQVLSGNYAGFDLRTSGTAASPIRFMAEPGVVISQVNPITSRDGINIENASHVVIEGFTLNSPNSSTRAGIRVVGDGFGSVNGEFSRFVTIRNNSAANWGKWGILTGFSHDLLIENNRMSGSVDEHGIYVSNSGDRPTIRGNVVFGNRANGIHMNGDIFTGDPAASPDVDGIIRDARIENNIIYGNGAGGGSGINGDGVVDARIVNNLLYGNQASGISLYQIDGGAASTGGEIINNTIINASNARWVINLRNGATGATLFNNILFNLNGSSLRGSIGAFEGSSQGLVSNYNLMDPRFSLVEGTTSLGLAAWIASTGNDQNSLPLTAAQMQALFTSYSGQDFTLNPMSAARDFGVAALLNGTLVQGPSTDLDGNPRPMGSRFDAGAYEYETISTPSCDFNHDNACNLLDLNEILSVGPVSAGVPSAGNEPLDLDGSGTIDNGDVDLWLSTAGTTNGFASAYRRGDANLDGMVDGSDFGIWNAHKFSSTLLWDQGNFNGDAVTDGGDFGLWNGNKFTSSDRTAAVPEPAANLVLCFSMFVSCWFRRTNRGKFP